MSHELTRVENVVDLIPRPKPGDILLSNEYFGIVCKECSRPSVMWLLGNNEHDSYWIEPLSEAKWDCIAPAGTKIVITQDKKGES